MNRCLCYNAIQLVVVELSTILEVKFRADVTFMEKKGKLRKFNMWLMYWLFLILQQVALEVCDGRDTQELMKYDVIYDYWKMLLYDKLMLVGDEFQVFRIY